MTDAQVSINRIGTETPDTPTSDYIPTTEALADPFTRELVLRSMKRDWQTFQRRYKHMAEFAEFIRQQVEGIAS